MTPAERLAEFARFVLQVMEDDKDWGADTLERIAARAEKLGLAKDVDGFFKAVLPEATK